VPRAKKGPLDLTLSLRGLRPFRFPKNTPPLHYPAIYSPELNGGALRVCSRSLCGWELGAEMPLP